MIHNNKVYANADEKFVKATIVYEGGGADGRFLYYDQELTKPLLNTEETFELFTSGLLFVNNGSSYTLAHRYNSDIGQIVAGTEYYTLINPTEE